MRVFLLNPSFSGERLYSLKSKERQYLNKVLRLDIGIEFTAKDHDDNYFKATLIDPDTLSLEPTDNPEDTLLDNLSGYKGPFAQIDMYISILKGKKNELVVKALTEIGVTRIVLVQSQYVQEKNFTSHQRERLETILKEAVQQSGAKAPNLEGPVSFEEAISNANGDILIMHQSKITKTKSLKDISLSLDRPISVFIGPEGGFSDEECNLAIERNGTPILLNTNILRAETASIYASSVVQSILHH